MYMHRNYFVIKLGFLLSRSQIHVSKEVLYNSAIGCFCAVQNNTKYPSCKLDPDFCCFGMEKHLPFKDCLPHLFHSFRNRHITKFR